MWRRHAHGRKPPRISLDFQQVSSNEECEEYYSSFHLIAKEIKNVGPATGTRCEILAS